MELHGIDGYPVPEGAVAGEIQASDGAKLRFARWRASGRRSQGTVCLFQGRAEFIEKYFEVVGDLRRRGFAVATFDWRGQGGSERRLRNRRKAHVDSFEEYDRDLDAFMQQVALPDCPPPHFALAHSTGGLVCLRALRGGRTRFTRAVLTSPLLGLVSSRPSPETAYRIAAFLTAIGLGEMWLPLTNATRPSEHDPFEANPLTSDPVRFSRLVELTRKLPEVTVERPTFGWLYAANRAIEESADPAFAPAVRVPTLIVCGSLDTVVSLAAIEALAAELRAGRRLLIPGARHEIMMERESIREQFWAAFDAFIPGS